ncbi:hypothetical protein [Georgenia faecalis]|uniref:Secreted protein n=1 Tax=Georgenia faecalis TaxID=2483799 RepID=A0ABV9D9S8_9MICO|nr:hypothetical protein [Georgenia faecalis]
MRRAMGGAALEPQADREAPGEAPGAEPRRGEALRTEFDFELPRGYLDADGVLHTRGSMRLATARDELLPLYDARVQENAAFTTVVLLARVITALGTLPSVTASVVENMFASDVAFLQDLYRRINAEGHTRAAVTCPQCAHRFTLDLSGGRLGES